MSAATSTAARHSSETNEHYTPRVFTDAAREVMGKIDLDPASCIEANRIIGAEQIWTAERNGFVTSWEGRVWLNPPGGKCDESGVTVTRVGKGKDAYWSCGPGCTAVREHGHEHAGVQSSQKAWWFKLAREFESGRVTEAVFLSFSVEIFQTTQVDPLGALPLDFPICHPRKRIAYVKAGGEIGASPPHSSALIYLGPKVDDFVRVFSRFGKVRR